MSVKVAPRITDPELLHEDDTLENNTNTRSSMKRQYVNERHTSQQSTERAPDNEVPPKSFLAFINEYKWAILVCVIVMVILLVIAYFIYTHHTKEEPSDEMTDPPDEQQHHSFRPPPPVNNNRPRRQVPEQQPQSETEESQDEMEEDSQPPSPPPPKPPVKPPAAKASPPPPSEPRPAAAKTIGGMLGIHNKIVERLPSDKIDSLQNAIAMARANGGLRPESPQKTVAQTMNQKVNQSIATSKAAQRPPAIRPDTPVGTPTNQARAKPVDKSDVVPADIPDTPQEPTVVTTSSPFLESPEPEPCSYHDNATGEGCDRGAVHNGLCSVHASR
jgi:hypothetical protein